MSAVSPLPTNNGIFSATTSTHDNIDISGTLRSANKVLQVHREKLKRRGNTVTPIATTPSPLATTPSPLATIPSPLATVPSSLARVSLPIATTSSPIATSHTLSLSDSFDDIEEINVTSEYTSDVIVTPTEAFISSYNRREDNREDNSVPLPINDRLTVPPPHTEPPHSPSLPSSHSPSHPPLHVIAAHSHVAHSMLKEEKKGEGEGEEGEGEVTQEELLEYQSFLTKLQSTSTGHVVTVSPAPSNQRSSYLNHNRSKLGIKNVVSMTTTSSNHSNRKDSDPILQVSDVSRTVQPIKTVHVLPIDSPRGTTIVRRGTTTPVNTSLPAPSKDQTASSTDPIPTHSDPTPTHSDPTPTHSDPTPTRSDPTPTRSDPTPTHSDPAPTHSDPTPTHSDPTPTHSDPTPTHSSDLFVEDIDDCELPSDPLIVTKQESNDTITENGSGSDTWNESESIQNGHESLQNGFESDAWNGSESIQNQLDTVIPNTPLMRGADPLRVDDKTKEEQKEEKNEKGEEEGEEDCSGMPLLRVKSTTSLYSPLNDSTFVSKRKRGTPLYSIHCSPDTVLPPPCPLYGIYQPTESELANRSLQQLRTSIRRKKRETEKEKTGMEKEKEKEKKGVTRKIISGEEDRKTSPTPSLSQSLYSLDRKQPVDLSLHKAVREGNHRLVQSLLSKGYDVNGIDEEGCTPLMYCVLSTGNVQLACADLLIRKGANIDQQAIDGSTVLHEAAIVGSVALIELLLLNGANPDIRDTDGRTPIHWSTGSQSVKALLLLLKGSLYGSDVCDGAEMTPLMWSCYNKNELIASKLIELGADLNEKDIDGRTAAHWAAMKCDINLLQLILKPDMTYFKDIAGRTVIHTAANEGFIRGIQLILSYRPDSIHDTDRMGRTPLHYAAAVNRVDICYMLLNRGSDVTQKDHQEKTPLHYASDKEHEFVVALFSCHNTSIGDFTKQHRLSPVRSTSNIISESISTTGLEPNTSKTSTSLLVENGGSYLGLFTEDDEIPPLHYYFWISKDSNKRKRRKLRWSRSSNKQNKKEARVQSVIGEPSQMIVNRRDYSPNDIHINVMTVITEEHGILDLLAYSESSYQYWLETLQSISSEQGEGEGEGEEREQGEEEGLGEQIEQGVGGGEESVGKSNPPLSSTPVHNIRNTNQPPLCYLNNVI